MMTEEEDDAALRVIGGVDTHKDVHVAAVIDELGRLLDTASFATTMSGALKEDIAWARQQRH